MNTLWGGCAFAVLICANSAAGSPLSEEALPVLEEFRAHEQQTWLEYIGRYAGFVDQSNYDVTFYHLAVDIGIASPYIEGDVLCRFKATQAGVDTIVLNLHHSLSVDSITGNVSSFRCADDSVHIALDHTHQLGDSGAVRVFYHGVPLLAGGYKGLRYETHGAAEPIIASLSTPFLAHYWWPCKDGPGDKPDSVYIDITIPDTTVAGIPLIAVSNGLLEGVVAANGKTTFQWRERYPIVPYYVMVAVSNYRHFQQVYSGAHGEVFPLDYYAFNEDFGDAQLGVMDMPGVMDLLSSYFGTYPFDTEKYGMTQLGFYGGIENQTNTIINSLSMGWLLGFVHELSHMWFGDMITCESWHHGWLNEGFATYSEALFLDYWAGWQAYKECMIYHQYFDGGTLYLQDISDPFNIFITIIYSKGAWVLHMLRGLLGDQAFFDCVYEYAQCPELRYGHATTEDFVRICEQVAGRNLGFFFDQWVYDERYPIYYWSYAQDDSTLDVTVDIRQTQGSNGWRPVFEMPIRLRLLFEDASDSVVTVWNDQEEQSFQFEVEKRLDRVGFDYGLWILKQAHQVGVDEAPLVPSKPLVSLGTRPNPFASATRIEYRLGGPAITSVRIRDLLGREVRALVPTGRQGAGTYTVSWDGRRDEGTQVAPGVYVCEIRADEAALTTNLLLTR